MPIGSAAAARSKALVSTHSNVNPDDFIKKISGGCKRIFYRTSCNTCSSDRGYQLLKRASAKGCDLCATHGKYERSPEQIEAFVQRSKLLNGRLGKKHATETKELLSKSQKDYCAKYGNQFRGKKHSDATKAFLSDKNSKQEPKWKGRVFKYDGPQGSFKLRSSWELAYAKYLDANNIVWKYEPKFKLSNGMSFCPDFQLNDGTIVEVKGFWTEKAKLKWSLFLKDYPDLDTKVLEQQELINLGVL